MATEQRSPQARLLRGLVGWSVLVPVLSIVLALVGARTTA